MGLTALAACALLVLPQVAQAAPSEEEIAAAKAAEEAAKMSVAQIEVKLAEVSANAAAATQNAQIAGEDLNEANIALAEATATASAASDDADAAEAAFQEGKQQIAAVAQIAYRNGGGSLDAIAPYLDSDGLRSVETKQAGINSFSASAEAKMQNVAALEQVAKVTRDAANAALANQEAATAAVQARTDAANRAAAAAQNEAALVAAQRNAYVQELAAKQNTTVDLINQREAALEAERQEAARIAAEQAAAAAEERRQAQAAAAEQAASQASSSAGDDDDDSPGSPAPSRPAPPYSPPASSGGGASTAIAAAKSYLGVPYVWGGESYGGVDCSGLTMLAWRSAGVNLPHLSRAQYGYGTHVPIGSMEPGDLIFWSSNGAQSGIYHVAMYLGGGQMIEAPTFGVPVRITGVYSWGSIMPYAVRL